MHFYAHKNENEHILWHIKLMARDRQERPASDGGEGEILQHVDQAAGALLCAIEFVCQGAQADGVAVCHEKLKQLLDAIQLVHGASLTRRGVWPSVAVMTCPDSNGSSGALTGGRFIWRVDKGLWSTIINIPVVYPKLGFKKWRQYGAGKCL